MMPRSRYHEELQRITVEMGKNEHRLRAIAQKAITGGAINPREWAEANETAITLHEQLRALLRREFPEA
jgi:hypothetical protein